MTKSHTEPQSDARVLPINKNVKDHLTSGEVHIYSVDLRRGQIIRIEIRERGLNVAAFLVRTSDDKAVRYSDCGFGYDRETLTYLTPEDDQFAVIVAAAGLPIEGHYELLARLEPGSELANQGWFVAENLMLEGLAISRHVQGDKKEAIAKWMEVAPVLAYLKEGYWEAWTCHQIGEAYKELGEYGKALGFFQRALNLFEAVEDKSGQARTLTEMGDTCLYIREMGNALVHFTHALQLIREVGNKTEEATILHNIGAYYNYTGQSKKAIEYFQQALIHREKVLDKKGMAGTLNNLGMAYARLDRKQEAIQSYERSLILNRELGNPSGEARTLLNLSGLYLVSEPRDEQTALTHLRRAFHTFQLINDKSAEESVLNSLMLVYSLQSNTRLATFYGKKTLNDLQQIRTHLQTLDVTIQKHFRRAESAPYRFLAGLLLKDNRLPEALQVITAFSDEQLFDPREESENLRAVLTFTPGEQELDEKIRKLAGEIHELVSQYDSFRQEIMSRKTKESEIEEGQLYNRLREVMESVFLSTLTKAEEKFAELISEEDRLATVPDLIVLQTTIRHLNTVAGQNSAAIFVFKGNEKFHILLVTDEEIKAFELAPKASELEEKILEVYARLRSPYYDPRPLSKELYEVFFKPMEPELIRLDIRTLMWSLDGVLRYLPVSALWDGDSYLVERYQHTVFTRFDHERLTRSVSSTWNGAAFGCSESHTVKLYDDPDLLRFSALPGVLEELNSIFRSDRTAGIAEGVVFLNREFTKSTFLNTLEKHYQVVHISSHFEFCAGDASRSFLLLGDGSVLTLTDLLENGQQLFQDVELLTLSACNTAAAQDANGREIDAFAELAQRLGASSVIASLWVVEDESTAHLMHEFYANRTVNAQTKAAALQLAQRALIEGKLQLSQGHQRANLNKVSGTLNVPRYAYDPMKPFAHPYYWSPFILIGNWL